MKRKNLRIMRNYLTRKLQRQQHTELRQLYDWTFDLAQTIKPGNSRYVTAEMRICRNLSGGDSAEWLLYISGPGLSGGLTPEGAKTGMLRAVEKWKERERTGIPEADPFSHDDEGDEQAPGPDLPAGLQAEIDKRKADGTGHTYSINCKHPACIAYNASGAPYASPHDGFCHDLPF